MYLDDIATRLCFERNVRKLDDADPGECYGWLGPHDRNGDYLMVRGRRKAARSLSYELYIGAIPKGCMVVPRYRFCGDWCINPLHLKLGSNAANVQAALLRSKGLDPALMPTLGLRFSEPEAREIMKAYQCGESYKELARRYEVGVATIRNVIEGKAYIHVRLNLEREALITERNDFVINHNY